MLCYYLLLRTSEYSEQFHITDDVRKYFKLIGLVIYTSYMDMFEEAIIADPGNIEEITLLGNIPTARQTPLYFCKFDSKCANFDFFS